MEPQPIKIISFSSFQTDIIWFDAASPHNGHFMFHYYIRNSININIHSRHHESVDRKRSSSTCRDKEATCNSAAAG